MGATTCDSSLILFGAFDRHNTGDLLFPHIASAMLKQEKPITAGLAQRDLRAVGGHAVQSIYTLAQGWQDKPVRILHVGGETLTCHAREAAVMLLQPSDARHLTESSDNAFSHRQDETGQSTGISASAPYVLARDLFPRTLKLVHHGIGGVELERLGASMQAEVIGALRQADFLTVRDRHTQFLLHQRGIDAGLVPDSVVLVRDLFADRIRRSAHGSETARIAGICRNGYVAVQCSADFSDDATLDRLAQQLTRITLELQADTVLFRMGAAPWHDDLDVYRRLASRMPQGRTHIAESLNIWDICALIAQSRGFCGSSLHGRIIASAYALPRATIRLPGSEQSVGKQDAYSATWEPSEMPGPVVIDQMAEVFLQSCGVPSSVLTWHARYLANAASDAFSTLNEQLVWCSCPQSG